MMKRLLSLLLVASAGALAGTGYDTPDATKGAARFPWPEGKRAALSLTFDDARLSQVDVGLPLLAEYGVKATFFVSPQNLERRIDGWRTAVAQGHEIGNHSWTHPCTGNYAFSRSNALEDFTLSRMAEEMDQANVLILERLGVRPSSYAYPCGQTFVGRGRNLRSTVPLVAERFTAGRGWLGEDANDPAMCDLALLLAMESDGKTSQELKVLLDHAIDRGGWLILCGHEIGDSGRQTTLAAALRALIEYALEPARGVWLAPVADISRYVARQQAATRKRRDTFDDRVEDLLSRMTLEEKIGQMNMPCVYEGALGRTPAEKMDACRRMVAGTFRKRVGPCGGFFTLPNTILDEGPRQQAAFLNELQRIAREQTRLGIPLLETEEGTHGLMCSGGTIFPEGPALGSTWNPELLREVYATAAREARAIGIHQLFTLVVEPIRDPRLGRNIEAYSEDPYLCARIAEAIVQGIQGTNVAAPDKTVAGLCHYPGQSQPVSGLERGAMEISPRMLREVFLPPWEAGIRQQGALGVMATYPAIDGVPTHGSVLILTDLLRGELGFDGLVLSEGGGLSTLIYEGLAASQKRAGQLALAAGVDVGISFESGYMEDLVESVQEGRVPVALVDRAVRRILRQKFRLGLFENPLVDPARAEGLGHHPRHVDLARQAAREGIVLLKNEGGILPLRRDLKRIAVLGPNADDAKNQLGDYTAITVLQDIVTVRKGVQALVSPQTEVLYAKGCNVTGSDESGIAPAVQAARAAEAAIVVVGENEWRARDTAGHRVGTSGEAFDAATLELTGRQEALVRAVVDTGTPTVVVLINGRPLATPYLAERVPAVVEAWLPGEQGGHAVAEVLFGVVNPSGRLPVTIPRHAGQLPVCYNARKSKRYWIEHGWGTPYVDLAPHPLYPFGHGLSYTTFEYRNLRCEPAEIGPHGICEVAVDVQNTGERLGHEVVQLYVEDLIASVATPSLELKAFRKIALTPGETQTVRFKLEARELALLNIHLDRVVEPGEFSLRIGRSAADLALRTTLTVRDTKP